MRVGGRAHSGEKPRGAPSGRPRGRVGQSPRRKLAVDLSSDRAGSSASRSLPVTEGMRAKSATHRHRRGASPIRSFDVYVRVSSRWHSLIGQRPDAGHRCCNHAKAQALTHPKASADEQQPFCGRIGRASLSRSPWSSRTPAELREVPARSALGAVSHPRRHARCRGTAAPRSVHRAPSARAPVRCASCLLEFRRAIETTGAYAAPSCQRVGKLS